MDRLAVLPLVWLCTLFLVGIALSKSAGLPLWIWMVSGGICLVCLLFEQRLVLRIFGRKRLVEFSPLPVSALLLAVCAGGAVFMFYQPHLSPLDLAWYNGSRGVKVTGWVAEPPRGAEKFTSLKIEAQAITLANGKSAREVQGRMFVQAPTGSNFRYGDRVEVSGDLTTPPGGESFSYREYLAIHEVYSWLARAKIARLEGSDGSSFLRMIFNLREKLLANINQMLPTDEAGLLIGVLLGDESGLSPSTREAFRETGTSHLLAVSGFNISVLAALLGSGARRFMPRIWSLIPVIVGLIVFSLMVGGQASVVRAAVMGCVAQVGLALGRRPAGGNALLFSAAVMSLFNPLLLWDIGFQLSFMATLGILLWGDAMTGVAVNLSSRLLPASLGARAGAWLAEFVLITLAAQIFTLPVSVYHFQTFSWIGLLANPLVLPVQQLLMFFGGLAAIASLVFLPAGQLLAWLAWPFCAYTLACVRLLASAGQGAWQTGQIPLILILIYFGLLLLVTAYGKRLFPALRKYSWQAAILLTGLLTLLLWRAYFAAPDGRLHITRIDYSAETAYFITSPSGSRILINGLTRPEQTAAILGRELFPFPSRLDALILTEENKTNRTGLTQFSSTYRFEHLLLLPGSGSSIASAINSSGPVPEVMELQTGREFELGGGAVLTVIDAGSDCADLVVVYKDMNVWIQGCEVAPSTPSLPSIWSMVSLSQDNLGKNEIKTLGRIKSGLTISSCGDPGLIYHPNWLMTRAGEVVNIVSDGRSMEVAISEQ